MSDASVNAGEASRPPKTPRPWPVPRVAAPGVSEVLARWASGEATPWGDAWDGTGLGAVPPGAPVSWGTARAGAGRERYRWTFCFESASAQSVLLWVNRLSDETALDSTMMERVPGTDLWVASFVMPDDWRASYCFLSAADAAAPPWRTGDQVALRGTLDLGAPDPRNPHTSRNRAGVLQSVVEGPGARSPWQQSDLQRTQVQAGWTRHVVHVGGRDVVVHEPSSARADLPVVVVLDGEVWEENQGFAATFARLVAEGRMRAQRLVLVPAGDREARWAALGGSGGGFVDWICDVLLPAVAKAGREPGRLSSGQVTVVGQSLGGLTALRAVLRRPDVVGWCLGQSASTWLEDLTGEASRWRAARGTGGVHLAVGTQEWALTPGHLALGTAFALPVEPPLGPRSVSVVAHQGGHDYAWWRHAVAEALVWQEEERRAGDCSR